MTVLHGEGKPRFYVYPKTNARKSFTISSFVVGASSVVITTNAADGELNALEVNFGLIGRELTQSGFIYQLMSKADRTFTGTNQWQNGLAGNALAAFDKTTDLTITASAAGQYCYLPVAYAPTTIGRSYTLIVACANLVGSWTVKSLDGTQTIGTITTPNATKTINFTATTTGGFRFVAVDNNSSGDFDNFTFYEMGFSSTNGRATITAYSDVDHTITTELWDYYNVDSDVTVDQYVIDLPYCQSLVETFIPSFLKHPMFNGRVKTKKKGWYYSAVLDYGDYLSLANIDKLKWLYRDDVDFLVFFPRLDNPYISYRVDLTEEPFTISQRQQHLGHRLVSISIHGIERLASIPLDANLIPTTTEIGYGKQYEEY